MKKFKKIISPILLLALLFFPIDYSAFLKRDALAISKQIEFNDPVIWTLDNAPISIINKELIFHSDLKIEAGVKIILGEETRLIVEGDFEAVGNKDHPVVFEGKSQDNKEINFSISLFGKENRIVNTKFIGGGGNQCLAQNSFWQSALANDCIPLAALEVKGGKLDVISSEFLDNYSAINIFDNLAEDSAIVNSTFARNQTTALRSSAERKVIAKSNCWMRPSGPNYESNPDGKGELVVGNVDVSDRIKCGSEYRPVIILPGIGGSWNWETMMENSILNDKWDFTPTTHYYDELIKSFEDKGYKLNRDLWIVFYDWRKDNHQTVENFLKPILKQIKEISFDRQFDIVAHSMGGLVSLDYLYDQTYQNDIRKLVMIGTPVLGSSKAYSVWEGGLIPDDWQPLDLYLDILSVKKENKGKDFYDLIHEKVPAVGQLMPRYDFVRKNGETDPVPFYEMHHQNEYIEELLNKIFDSDYSFDSNNILMIEGTEVETAKEVLVDDYDGEKSDKLWLDGKPNPFPLKKEEKKGDGTVLNESSAVFFLPGATKEQISGAGHSDLPTLAIEKVHNFLELGDVSNEYALAEKRRLVFAFACPIEVTVVDPDGKKINRNSSEIANAYFYDDGQTDGYKIVEIQKPKKGDYRLELTGTGSGEYHIFGFSTDGDQTTDVSIEGEIEKGQRITYLSSGDKEDLSIKMLYNQADEEKSTEEITTTEPTDDVELALMSKESLDIENNKNSNGNKKEDKKETTENNKKTSNSKQLSTFRNQLVESYQSKDFLLLKEGLAKSAEENLVDFNQDQEKVLGKEYQAVKGKKWFKWAVLLLLFAGTVAVWLKQKRRLKN